MGGAHGDALDQCAVHVAAGVGQVQAEKSALGLGVVDRGPLAREIGQHQEPVRAGGGGRGFGSKRREGLVARQFLRELVAEPVGQCARRGEARHGGVLAGCQPGRVPEPGVADGIGGDLDDENGGAVHHHHVARCPDPDADRLGCRVNGAAGDRSAFREAGFGGGRRGHVARDLRAPEKFRQAVEGQNVFR